MVTIRLSNKQQKLLLLQYRINGNLEARNKLVCSSMPYIKKMAYNKSPKHLDDLTAEGIIGLMHAIEKFQIERKIELMSYAAFWIRYRMDVFLIENCYPLKVPLSKQSRKMHSLSRKLNATNTNFDSNQTIELFNMSKSDIKTVRAFCNNQSYEYNAEYTTSHCDEWQNQILTNHMVLATLKQCNKLSSRDLAIIKMKLIDGYTLVEIGKQFNITSERVRQIVKAILRHVHQTKKDSDATINSSGPN